MLDIDAQHTRRTPLCNPRSAALRDLRAGAGKFFGRAICLFMNMDRMLGGQFVQGLTNLTGVVEAAAKP
ncbi:MAG: hypothetical protein H0W78_03885 [Planctomycetes bacterium]|nr:hypothetical protein [Planctomycetota bacterium]